jgi:transaldolase
MALFLDSASADDARKAAMLGFVAGITTNPTLVAGTGRAPADVIAELCDVHPGLVFYQPVASTVGEAEAEVRRISGLRPGRVGIKLPSTTAYFALGHRLAQEGFVVGMTAIFSPAQAYLACQIGARYVLPYVNRSTRLLGDGPGLVRAMRAVLEACGGGVEILAASIKTRDEAVETLLAGAHSLTIPLALIEALGQHEHSDRAIADFAASVRGTPAATP